MATPNVLDYDDYREYAKDVLEGIRETRPLLSLRHFAKCIGLDAGNLVKLVQKERHLPDRCLAPLIVELGLNRRDSLYLEHLVAFGKARTSEQTRTAYERLLDLKFAKPEVVGREQYAFYKDWKCTAVLAMLHLNGIRPTETVIAGLLEPRSTAEEVAKVLRLLETLGLTKRARGGKWVACKSLITTGEAWKDVGIRAFQKETLRLAERAMERIPREERDISTLTVTLGEKELAKVRDMAREFRRAVLDVASNASAADRVWQLNLQVFPLSGKPEVVA